MSNIRKTVAAASVAGAIALTGALDASAQERVRWKMQSAFGSTLPVLGTRAVAFSETIEKMSGGSLQLKFFEPGSLVPTLEGFNAVAKGSFESSWTTPGYHTGALGAAVSFFTAVPFGPQIGEYLAWKWYGGGQELREELYNAQGATAIDNSCIGPETSGWFRVEVDNPQEYFKGLKMRFFGLGAQVMQKMGANTQLLSGADIFPALEKGVIDATEFSMPITDIKYGFHQVTKYNYFPGWHQQTSCGELLMNQAMWNEMPEQYKEMIHAAARGSLITSYVETEALNPPAMTEMVEKHGVNVRRWDDGTLGRLELAWLEVIDEKSAEDAFFKKVADSYLAFRKLYRIWGDAQSLKGTYQ